MKESTCPVSTQRQHRSQSGRHHPGVVATLAVVAAATPIAPRPPAVRASGVRASGLAAAAGGTAPAGVRRLPVAPAIAGDGGAGDRCSSAAARRCRRRTGRVRRRRAGSGSRSAGSSMRAPVRVAVGRRRAGRIGRVARCSTSRHCWPSATTDRPPDLPLIVSYPADRSPAPPAPGWPPRRRDGRDLSSVDALAYGRQGVATALWAQVTGADRAPGHRRPTRRRDQSRVADGRVRTHWTAACRDRCAAAWDAGHTGRGVTVAVLDTGIDASHPTSPMRWTPAGLHRQPDGVRTSSARTHVASIITARRRLGRPYAEVAPDARLLVGKVLDDTVPGSSRRIVAGWNGPPSPSMPRW